MLISYCIFNVIIANLRIFFLKVFELFKISLNFVEIFACFNQKVFLKNGIFKRNVYRFVNLHDIFTQIPKQILHISKQVVYKSYKSSPVYYDTL